MTEQNPCRIVNSHLHIFDKYLFGFEIVSLNFFLISYPDLLLWWYCHGGGGQYKEEGVFWNGVVFVCSVLSMDSECY